MRGRARPLDICRYALPWENRPCRNPGMSQRTRGLSVAFGGLVWLAGVLILELTYDTAADDLPLSFSLLAGVAGIAVGWGCWSAASPLDGRLGRIGMRSVAVCSAVLGLGFWLDAIPNMWLGFLLAYSVGLFVLPFAFLILGIGAARSVVFPTWGKWIPFSVTGVAVVTYAFHALAREVWDPPDAVWFVALGVGWILIGMAIIGFAPGARAVT